MDEKERLKNEVRELLTHGKAPIISEKKIFYDKVGKQYLIKIPSDIASAIETEKIDLKIVANPSDIELDEAMASHFIIYAKTKEHLK